MSIKRTFIPCAISSNKIKKSSYVFPVSVLIVSFYKMNIIQTILIKVNKFFYHSCLFTFLGISVGVLSSKNDLGNVGLYLAPALAAGYNIVLQVGKKIAPSIYLLLELANKVG